MRPARPPRIVHCLSVLGLGLALVGSLVGCDTVGDSGDSEMTVVVEVEGLDPYTFSNPSTAMLQPVPGASTQVLSIRLDEQPSAERRIGLQIDLEVTDLVADSTYVLYSVISRGHIGDGEPSMWARFFDCPPVGICRRDYYAFSSEVTLFFVQITMLTESRVTGAFGFTGLSVANPGTVPKVTGRFSMPLVQ